MPLLSFVPTVVPARPRGSTRRVGIVSTYPPQLCGLATFAAALGNGLRRGGHVVDMIRIEDARDVHEDNGSFAGVLRNGAPESIRRVAAVLSRCDVAIVQHEYGIYGGVDGDEVVALLTAITAPTIVVLHTVPLIPSPHQKTVLEEVCALADGVVVMSATAHERLLDLYSVDGARVETIPHGATLPTPQPITDAEAAVRPELLTWGLLGPGKGIEHAIDAIALLSADGVRARYTIAGVTHPKVFAAHGDQYRHSLIRRSWAASVARSVGFDDTYRALPELTRFVASATAVVLPYDSRDQVTSGVLVDAIAAGRPVIATAFPHAVELLATGAGIVVPHNDPVALAAAIRTVLLDDDALASMTAEARRLAPSLSWAAVADSYVRLADELAQAGARIAI